MELLDLFLRPVPACKIYFAYSIIIYTLTKRFFAQMFFSIGGLNPGNIITTMFISYRIVDGKSEIELSSEHIEISRKFKEEVVQPILKVKNNYRHLLHSWFVFCCCCFAKRVLVF
jgi:hypothetical protein